MHYRIRHDNITPAYTTFTLFCEGARCGQLCMRNEEAERFFIVLTNGVALTVTADPATADTLDFTALENMRVSP